MRFRAALGLIGLVSLGCGNVASDDGGERGNPNPGPSEYPKDPTQSTPPGSVPPPPTECPGVGVATGEWSFELDGAGESYADAVAVTPSGSVFVSGTSVSSIGPVDKATGDTYRFVARFAPDGELLWVNRYLDGFVTLLGDGEEGVFLTGTLNGTVDMQHSTLLEHLDCHGNSLAKLEAASDGVISYPSLALRNDGKLILAGKFLGDLGIGGTPQSPKESPAVFIAELGADGSHGWVKTFDDPFEGNPKVVTASNGESILAISAKGYPVLGQPDDPPVPPTGQPFPPEDQAKTHVARYDIAGNGLGVKRLDGEGFDSVRASSIDASDRLFIGLDTGYPAGNAAVLARVEPGSQLYSTMELGISPDPIVMTSSFFEGDQLFLSAIAPKDSNFGSGPTAEWGSVVLVFDATNSKLVSATSVGPVTGKVYGFIHSAGRSVIVGSIPSEPGSGSNVTGFVSVK